MDKWTERLQEIRGDRSQGQIAEYTGIGQVTLSNWEKGAPKSIENLRTLAAYYKVSADYLLGLVNSRAPWDIQNEARAISEWPPTVRELAEIASQLPEGMIQTLIALARDCVEIRRDENERVLQGLIEAGRIAYGEEMAVQLTALARKVIDDVR